MTLGDENLKLKDLELLMDTYSNMINMNSVLVGQVNNVIEMQKQIDKKQLNIIEKIEKVDKKLETMDKDTLSNKHFLSGEHSKIFNNIYVSMIGMGSIVVSLIGLIYLVVSKNNLIEKIYDLLTKLNNVGL